MYETDTDHLSLLTFDVRYGYRPPVSLPAIDDSMVDILTIAALLQFNPVSLDDFAACLRYGNNAYKIPPKMSFVEMPQQCHFVLF